MNNTYYKPKEAASLLTISMSTFWKLVREGKLKADYVSEKRRVVSQESIDNYLRSIKFRDIDWPTTCEDISASLGHVVSFVPIEPTKISKCGRFIYIKSSDMVVSLIDYGLLTDCIRDAFNSMNDRSYNKRFALIASYDYEIIWNILDKAGELPTEFNNVHAKL